MTLLGHIYVNACLALFVAALIHAVAPMTRERIATVLFVLVILFGGWVFDRVTSARDPQREHRCALACSGPSGHQGGVR